MRRIGTRLGAVAVLMLATAVAFAPAAQADTAGLVISELRFAGPDGVHDGFVELFNPGAEAIYMNSDRMTFAAADGSSSSYLLRGDVPAHGHFLVTDSAFSLEDQIRIYDQKVSLTKAPVGVQLTDMDGSTLYDAVGLTSAPSTFREGSGLAPLALDGQTAYVRHEAGGLPQDTGDNATDFVTVATDAPTVGYGTRVELGTPGPQDSRSVPAGASVVSTGLADPSVGATTRPNLAFDPAKGTVLFRRTVINTSSDRSVVQLQLRVTDLSTFGSADPGDADVRLGSAPGGKVALHDGSTATVLPSSLVRPSSQPVGGGVNSILTVPLPGGGLNPGKSVTVAIQGEVRTPGDFDLAVDPEIVSTDYPSPTVAVTPTRVAYRTPLRITGSGFYANEVVIVRVGGKSSCVFFTGPDGGLDHTGCRVPALPAGAQSVTVGNVIFPDAVGDPVIVHPSQPNAVATAGTDAPLRLHGFAADSALTVRFDDSDVTPTPTPVTHDDGSLDLTVPVPSGARIGAHGLTVTDSAGNSRTGVLRVYAPTVALNPSSGPAGTHVAVSGQGWPAGEVRVAVGDNVICAVDVGANGVLRGSSQYCQVRPRTRRGEQPVTATQHTSSIGVHGSPFTVTAAGTDHA